MYYVLLLLRSVSAFAHDPTPHPSMRKVRTWSGAQTLTPFTATTGDDCTTTAGLHPRPEAVGLFTATIIGLECTLHGVTPSWE